MEKLTPILTSKSANSIDHCYFFRQFEKDWLLNQIVISKHIEDRDFEGLCYERTSLSECTIFGFPLTGIGFFDTVSILKTRFGSIVELTTFNTEYFDQSGDYFNIYTPGRVSGYYQRLKEKYVVKCKRLKRFYLHGKRIDCSIHRCELYGCKIMISIQ